MRRYARTAWRLAGRPPGPWLLAISLAGWTVLALRYLAVPSPGRGMPGMHGSRMAAHGLVDWLAMVTAMSPLVLRSEVHWLWRTSFPRNRGSAVALYALGYALPWVALGFLWTALLFSGHPSVEMLAVLSVALLAWHSSPGRQRLLNACHRRPGLRAFGSAMAEDVACCGLRSGLLCVAVCGPAMVVAMAVPGGHLAAMAAVTAVLTVERYLAPRRAAWRLPFPWSDREPRWRSLAMAAAPSVTSS